MCTDRKKKSETTFARLTCACEKEIRTEKSVDYITEAWQLPKKERDGNGKEKDVEEKLKERRTGLDQNFVAQFFFLALTQYVLESDSVSC